MGVYSESIIKNKHDFFAQDCSLFDRFECRKGAGEPTMRGRWHIDDQLTGLGELRLRESRSRDEDFLLQLFRSSRPHLAQIPMPTDFVETLVQQQYQLQRSSYSRQFPGHQDVLILLHQEPIGNMKLHEDAEVGCLRLLDIGIRPEHQRRGHGGSLLQALQSLAAQNDWVLRLAVDHQNWRAKKLYSSLGFKQERVSATHEEMMWTSAVCATD